MTETQKAGNEEKESQKTSPFPDCGQFQKMAEMMKNSCPTKDGDLDCCSFERMMGKGNNAQEIKEKTQKAEKRAEK